MAQLVTKMQALLGRGLLIKAAPSSTTAMVGGRDRQRRGIASKMIGGEYMKAEIVRKKGKNLLSDPIFNKGLGFPRTERDRLGIRGLVPPSTLNMAQQEDVLMAE